MLLHVLLDAVIDCVDRRHRALRLLEAADVGVLCASIIDSEYTFENILGYALDSPGFLGDCPDGAVLLVGAPACGMAGFAALEASALFQEETRFCALWRAVFAAAIAAACLGSFSLWCAAGLRRQAQHAGVYKTSNPS